MRGPMTPAANANRSRVLRAATSAFLAHGYRSSVEQIARRAISSTLEP